MIDWVNVQNMMYEAMHEWCEIFFIPVLDVCNMRWQLLWDNMWNVDDERVLREILGDGVGSVCLDIGDV